MAFGRLGLAVAMLGMASAIACAQPGHNHSAVRPGDDWQRSLDRIEKAINAPSATEPDLDYERTQVAAVLASASEARAAAEAQIKPLKDQLAALGPVPAKGQPPEAPAVAQQRQKLVDDITGLDTRVKQAELAIARGVGLRDQILRISSARLAERLFAHGPSPLSIDVLAASVDEFGGVAAQLGRAPLIWWRSAALDRIEPDTVAWLAFAIVFALVAAWPLRRFLLRRYGRASGVSEPSYARRVLATGVEGLARGLLPAAGLIALAAVLVGGDVITGQFADIVTGVAAGLVLFSVTAALARAALAPAAPEWRIVPFGAEASRVFTRRLSALAAVAGFTLCLRFAFSHLEPKPHQLFVLLGFILETVLSVLSLTLLERRLWQRDGAAAPQADEAAPPPGMPGPTRPARGRWQWPALRLALIVALAAVPFISLAGYGHLAFHIVSRIVLTGLLAGAILLVRTLLQELIEVLFATDRPRLAVLRHSLALSDPGSEILVFWLDMAIDLLLVLPSLGLLLLLWGVPIDSLSVWASSAINGIRIGGLRLSLIDLALALVVFAAVLAATRLFQRLLAERLLPQTRLDAGVRHSLSTVVGYLGFLVAATFAVSTLGISLSKLAIIAGALSVGIGFGLQNIVSNFVSGLVLLFERPIKVGDWVVVGQHQGFVTRISVRSTELETFERASVIIPNSELLSAAVVNWTHRDKYGRVAVPVGVAYGSDTERVRELLLACAKAHDQILAWPKPYVLYTSFGDSALQFELRGYIANVENRWHVESDLHFAIDRAFREAGIDMPFPQRDLNLRNVDELARAIIAARGAEIAAGRREAVPATPPAQVRPARGAKGEPETAA